MLGRFASLISRRPIYDIKEFRPAEGDNYTSSLIAEMNVLSEQGWEILQVSWPFPGAKKCFIYVRR